MHQGIYNIIDEAFRNFVVNNKKLIDDMEFGEVVDLRTLDKTRLSRLCRPDMLEFPFNICYLSKLHRGEGYSYIFLDKGLNKLYDYYDVD